ncbi:asparaginase [Clostridium sp. WILCCON 0269]|uniref:Asparaginase n=1 Tax=Candidatus Clostridium eludens TaxID=3381663 RepID=A0ABW8SLT0_9CLOT
MSEIVVKVTRGLLTESIHRADIAVVSSKGKLLYSLGDPYKTTYMRSAAKPIQTLNVILSGADQKFSFTDGEISIMCASHYGEDFHRKTVEEILKKIGLDVNSLLCGSTLSLNEEYAKKLLWNHVRLNPSYTDCSGKHCGILAVCVLKGYDLNTYNLPEHPVQKEIKKILSEVCSVKEDSIIVGVDGCTVPIFGIPLYNMALGFCKMANDNVFTGDYKNAAHRVFKAMTAVPEMVAGTGGFCTELMKNTGGKLIGKLGAEGIYCVGVKGMDLGLAIKIEDGSTRALWPTTVKCLEDLQVLNEEEKKALSKFKIKDNVNNRREKVGEIFPGFYLNKN